MVKRLFGFGDSQRQANAALAAKLKTKARMRKFNVMRFLREKLATRELAAASLSKRIEIKREANNSLQRTALQLAGEIESGKQKEKTMSDELKVQQDANTLLQDQYQEVQVEIEENQKYLNEKEPMHEIMQDCLRNKEQIMMLADCKSKLELRQVSGVNSYATLRQFTANQLMLDGFCEDLNTQGIYMSVAYEGEGPLSTNHNKDDVTRVRELAKIFGVDAQSDPETAALEQLVDGLVEEDAEDDQQPPSKKQKTG